MNVFKTAAFLAAALVGATPVFGQSSAEDYFILTPAPGVIDGFSNYFTLVGEDGATIANGEKAQQTITLACPSGDVIDMQTARLGTVIRIAFPTSVDIPTAPGDYTLFIPADRFAVDGVGNLDAAYVYTIEGSGQVTPDTPSDVAIHVTPAPGKVTSLSEWMITFGGEWGLENRSAKFRLTGPEGLEIPSFLSGSVGTGYSVQLADGAVLTTPGTYVFTIPEGKFSLGDSRDPVLNPEITCVYIIDDAGVFPQYSILPAPGSYKTIDNGFTLTFETGQVEIADASEIVLVNPEFTHLPITVSVSGSSVSVMPNDGVLSQEGGYSLRFGAGSLSVDGVCNGRPYLFTYQLTSATGEIWQGDWSVTPAPGEVENLGEIDFTFAGVRKVKVSDNASPSDFPVLYNSYDQMVCRGTVFGKGSMLMISLTPEVSAPGDYRLVVPKQMYLLDGATPAQDIVVEYTINGNTEGIGAVSIADADADVYTITGAATGVKASGISALPSGIYIVSGRKIVK